jgi:hypothetical protein
MWLTRWRILKKKRRKKKRTISYSKDLLTNLSNFIKTNPVYDHNRFKKRIGVEPVSLGGRPRSLEPDDIAEEKSRSIDVKNIR